MNAPRYAAECIGPGVVLLRDQAVGDAMILVRESLKTMRPNAVALPRCQRLLRELERAYLLSVSLEREYDVVSIAAEEESYCQDETDEITTREAAHLLGVDVRTVQRLAP